MTRCASSSTWARDDDTVVLERRVRAVVELPQLLEERRQVHDDAVPDDVLAVRPQHAARQQVERVGLAVDDQAVPLR